jgi:hypothetical protein
MLKGSNVAAQRDLGRRLQVDFIRLTMTPQTYRYLMMCSGGWVE